MTVLVKEFRRFTSEFLSTETILDHPEGAPGPDQLRQAMHGTVIRAAGPQGAGPLGSDPDVVAAERRVPCTTGSTAAASMRTAAPYFGGRSRSWGCGPGDPHAATSTYLDPKHCTPGSCPLTGSRS